MKIQRTLPPAAAPLDLHSIFSGLSGLIIRHKATARFELELKKYFGVNHCWLVSSGKTALYIILCALKKIHPERNEILIPGFTCYSVPAVIIKAGLTIRLCDIDQTTLDFNYTQFEDIISKDGKKILAVLPTHLFGLSSNINRVKRIAGRSGITVIEDAAQSMGNDFKGQKHGTMGDVGFLSLSRGKSFSTMEGGVVLTGNESIARAVSYEFNQLNDYSFKEKMFLVVYSLIISLFIRPSLFWLPSSLPFLKLGETIFDKEFNPRKMSFFQGGISNGWQRKLSSYNKIRMLNSKYWFDLINNISSFSFPDFCQIDKGVFFLPYFNNFSCIRFPLIINDPVMRDGILEKSKMMGAGIMPSYPDSIDGIENIIDNSISYDCKSAKQLAKKIVTLPTHSYVNENDRKKIRQIIIDVWKEKNQKLYVS